MRGIIAVLMGTLMLAGSSIGIPDQNLTFVNPEIALIDGQEKMISGIDSSGMIEPESAWILTVMNAYADLAKDWRIESTGSWDFTDSGKMVPVVNLDLLVNGQWMSVAEEFEKNHNDIS